MTNSTERISWICMLRRCYNEKHRAHKFYAPNGITVCDNWRESFENFLADMGRKPSKRHTLERIDNSKGYSPDNCRWATWTEQARNRKDNRIVTYKGKRMTLAEASERAGLTYQTVWARIDAGWPVAVALRTPIHSNAGSLRSIAAEAGINYGLFYTRVRVLGWSIERAIKEPSQQDGNSLRAKASAAGLPYKAVHLRITRYGWTEERALSKPVKPGRKYGRAIPKD